MSYMVSKHTYGKISYTLKRKAYSQLKIVVRDDATVMVVAPKMLPHIGIELFLQQKYAWIIKQRKRYRSKKTLSPPQGLKQTGYTACKGRAEKFLRERVHYYNQFYGFSFSQIKARNTSTQWGSCSQDGNLSFCYKILFLPVHLAGYIVVHELCHLKEMNHGPRFWALVKDQMPDYKRRVRDLRAYSMVVK